jgi:hypothetical protein
MSENLSLLAEADKKVTEFVEAVSLFAANGTSVPYEQVERVCLALEAAGAWLEQQGSEIAKDPALKSELTNYQQNLISLDCAIEQMSMLLLERRQELSEQLKNTSAARAWAAAATLE